MACAMRQLLIYPVRATSHVQFSSPYQPISRSLLSITRDNKNNRFFKLTEFSCHRNLTEVAKASPGNDGIVAADDEDDGVSLGTMKLPMDTDIQRFESLLFQWANSLCQGANLPLPMPLKEPNITVEDYKELCTAHTYKLPILQYVQPSLSVSNNSNDELVDKIPSGARLGFITIGDGKTDVLVYIDCLVFPASGGSGPIFRAIRNGPLKDKSPPGEPRIMRSLQQALKKSVEIARV